MPALPPYIIEPIFEQFRALLPERKTDHPLGCHKPRIPDGVVFGKLVEVLVFGCAYERIADACCSESTLRRRRDEWIELGVMERLREISLDAYDRLIGLDGLPPLERTLSPYATLASSILSSSKSAGLL